MKVGGKVAKTPRVTSSGKPVRARKLPSAEFPDQLVMSCTVEMGSEVRAYAERNNISQSELLRRVMGVGWSTVKLTLTGPGPTRSEKIAARKRAGFLARGNDNGATESTTEP